jgi:LmbE family N-acetylglucosaminyl deacetylase
MHLQNIISIHRHYDYVFISPHFDDVAASCSGRISKQIHQGKSVLVVTVFTKDASRVIMTVPKALKSTVNYQRRRKEDSLAMQRMGVDYLWLEHPEMLFRNQKPWSRYWPNYRDTPSNKTLCHKLRHELHEICRRTDCKNLVLPLGVGQHVDHQIIFQASNTLGQGHNQPFRSVFYEETPYALFPFLLIYRLKKAGIRCSFLWRQFRQTGDTGPFSAKEAFHIVSSLPSLGLHRPILKPWVFLFVLGFTFYTRHLMKPSAGFFDSQSPYPEICDITPFIDRKLFVISAYTSQLSGPMMTEQRIKTGLSAYARSLGMSRGSFGERYWTTSDSNIS